MTLESFIHNIQHEKSFKKKTHTVHAYAKINI